MLARYGADASPRHAGGRSAWPRLLVVLAILAGAALGVAKAVTGRALPWP
jgi:hypothetical protein